MLDMVISLVKGASSVYGAFSNIRRDKKMQELLDSQSSMQMQLEKLSDNILYAPDAMVLKDTTKSSQQKIDDLREVKSLLEPVQRSFGDQILSSSAIVTPRKMQQVMGHNPWEVLLDIRPWNRARPPQNPDQVPIMFEDDGMKYIGWQLRGVLPMMFDCEFDPNSDLWLTQPSIQNPYEISTKPTPRQSQPRSTKYRSRSTKTVHKQRTVGETISISSFPEQKMVWCLPGTFTMGEGETAHEVTLTKGFWMGQMPVTQELWESVMGDNPSRFSGKSDSKQRPVEKVSWYDTVKFCNMLSEKEGLKPVYDLRGDKDNPRVDDRADGYRLPTEAQWEYACRAGTTSPRYGEVDDIAWYVKNSGNETHAVGQKQANAWGLHDMLGNVWEWCWDWYGDYSTSAVTDPVGNSTGTRRVNRGGGWFSRAAGARAAGRCGISPGRRSLNLGFRLVRLGP